MQVYLQKRVPEKR